MEMWFVLDQKSVLFCGIIGLLYCNLLKMQGGSWEMEDQFFCSRKAF